MVEQLARFLGVSCDKAQLEALIEHCHQLVDQCCNAEALPVGRGTRPAAPEPLPLPRCLLPPPGSAAPRLAPPGHLEAAPSVAQRGALDRCAPSASPWCSSWQEGSRGCVRLGGQDVYPRC